MFSQQVFAVRHDLVIREIHQGRRICWVVKDPVARKFFYFNEQEYAILSWLDGTNSVQTIVTRFCRKFAPMHLSPIQLSGFLSELARADLLKGPAGAKPVSAGPSLAPRLGEVVRNPLAIRLPGINPTWFLEKLAPWCRWMFSTTALVLAGLLILTALICVIVRFDDLQAAVPRLQAAGTSGVLMTAAIVLILSKIIHELAHALTARHFGVRCESMGVLLLILTPCLYCDVSDAWMLASRRARMAISAAGILAELVLAALATLLWMISRDDPTRAVLLMVMIVCSANTLLFNGNPLMRYDGYFLLSDLLGMPNLAAESVARITSRLRSSLWDEPPVFQREETPRERLILWTYGLLSLAYRLVLLIVILSGIYRILEPAGFGILGVGLAWMVSLTALAKVANSLLRPPAGLLISEPRHLRRPVLAAGGMLAVLIGLGLIPLPRRLDVPFRIDSRQSRDVFTSVAGQLTWAVPPGQTVQVGEQIAILRNPAIELQLRKIDLELALQRSRLKSLEARRGLLDHADERPALIESIAALEQRQTVLAREKRELVIHAPQAGVIHEPPNFPETPREPASETFWTGTPLDLPNRGCHLPQGAFLCSITEAAEKLAILYISQKRVQQVRPGQAVHLWLPGFPGGGLHARVVEVSAAPLEEIPRELLARNVIALNPASATGNRQPLEPMYRVTARLPETHIPLPLRATGRASIRTGARPLWKIFREWIYESLDF